ncbi:MAG: glycine--tRNA ligase subunit beta [Deltaproteobacteria bacterium]|nr:glycine--tRNA ligase subunit beta [Deltaproteobacteria bacterium]
MTTTRTLLFEIGCEELPASFVDGAVKALPALVDKQLGELRLGHGEARALGTPRRLAVLVPDLELEQADLEEEVTGPPAKVAFDAEGKPTRAAEAFAKKVGCDVGDLERVTTPKGEYLKGTRREQGKPATDLLPTALAAIATAIPFRKSMRWGAGSLSFGRPVRWLVALLGSEVVPVTLGDLHSGRSTYGHRFLHPQAIELSTAEDYVAAMREARVVVDPAERAQLMEERLREAAKEGGGELIEDDFLIGENLSLVEEPQVVVGSFEEEFLALPEEVILEVARGHQRYFGLRGPGGELLPKYLAVVNTACNPDKIRLGNDRVMRARLADARFFHSEDLKRPLGDRRTELAGIVFQKRLGSVLHKARRIERLVGELGRQLGLDEATVQTAVAGAGLCKCDLVTWMVGEFPELQGAVGRAYALAQGLPVEVADTIRDHYLPRGAHDDTAPSHAAALVGLADRLDTLVGCFGIGLSPTGAADPYGLRRACIGTLRTLLDRGLDLGLVEAFAAAHGGYEGTALDLDAEALTTKLVAYSRDRLRGLLTDRFPTDVVEAALGVAANRPLDARARAEAIAELDVETRGKVGEVFKRATNIAKEAPAGEPERGPEPAEVALHDAFFAIQAELASLSAAGDYPAAFAKLATLAPTLAVYFDEVLVMAKEPEVRDNRLRLMRVISETCSALAKLEVLGG